jgi:hypothetical protein
MVQRPPRQVPGAAIGLQSRGDTIWCVGAT